MDKVFSWLGWLFILIGSALIGAVVGCFAGIIAGPVKAFTWLNESQEVSSPSNDSI